ncbi:MAG: hypothetical protein GTO00_06745 [Deltaproteobacteria bacterium]|nr:hypothetical protein [Deltaproteobacteria bacterium]
MKKDDLTRLKYIETSRMKLLNKHGITTIKQLFEMPEEKLAGIKSIGNHYARLIKSSAADYYREKQEIVLPEILSDEERKAGEISENLRRKIRKLQKTLHRVNENLKPMGKKKYLPLYIDLKKTSSELRDSLALLEKSQENIPLKAKKKIIKRSDALALFMKKGGKKPRKKAYKKITLEIQSFSKVVRNLIP